MGQLSEVETADVGEAGVAERAGGVEARRWLDSNDGGTQAPSKTGWLLLFGCVLYSLQEALWPLFGQARQSGVPCSHLQP